MAIILPPQRGLAENLGEALGSGISNYTSGKLQDLLQRNQRQQTALGLQGLFEPGKAQQLSNLPLEILQPLVTQQAKMQERIPTSSPGLKQIMPELNDQEAEKIGSLTPALQTLVYRNYLDTPAQLRKGTLDTLVSEIGSQTPVVPAQVSRSLVQQGQQQMDTKPGLTKEQRIAEHLSKRQASSQITPTILQPAKPKTVAELVKNEGMSVKDAREAIKEEKKAEQVASKENLKFYQDTLKSDVSAKNNDKRLDRMLQLVDKGNLPNSTTYRLFKALGDSPVKVPVPLVGPIIESVLNTLSKAAGGIGSAVQRGITATDTEEFEKLTQDFTRDAKDVYGSRITNYDLEQFMQMIPTLMQTDNGKKAVIRNMKNFNEATHIKAKIMKDIIKENGGRRPANLEILVDERAAPYLDASAQRFISGVSNEQSQPKQGGTPVQLPFQQLLGGIEV